MKPMKFGLLFSDGLAALMLASGPATVASAAGCPAVTVANDQGIAGKYPQQFYLSKFEYGWQNFSSEGGEKSRSGRPKKMKRLGLVFEPRGVDNELLNSSNWR